MLRSTSSPWQASKSAHGVRGYTAQVRIASCAEWKPDNRDFSFPPAFITPPQETYSPPPGSLAVQPLAGVHPLKREVGICAVSHSVPDSRQKRDNHLKWDVRE